MKILLINKIRSGEGKISEAMENKNQAIFSFQKTEPATFILPILHNIN